MMDKIDKILEYVRRTNPQMTREQLVYELGRSTYATRSLVFTANNSQLKH
jgi:hypothetical protein